MKRPTGIALTTLVGAALAVLGAIAGMNLSGPEPREVRSIVLRPATGAGEAASPAGPARGRGPSGPRTGYGDDGPDYNRQGARPVAPLPCPAGERPDPGDPGDCDDLDDDRDDVDDRGDPGDGDPGDD